MLSLLQTPEALMTMSILLPLLAAIVSAITPQQNLRDGLQIFIALLLALNVYNLLSTFAQGNVVPHVPLEFFPGVTLRFAIDNVGILFMLVASVLWPVALLYSVGYMRANNEQHQCRFYAFYAIAIAATMGLAMAGNLFTLFLFYEILTLSTFPLVAHHGTPEAKKGARTYLFILLSTSILFLLGAIVWTYEIAGTTDFTREGLMAGRASPVVTGMLLALFMFGIGKAALMPFHRWLPAAMVAPTPVSALLHAVAVVKAGVFTAIKVVTSIFGVEHLHAMANQSWWAGGWLLWVAGGTVILASTVALTQDNLKKRLAYSTISQLAYVLLALALFTPLGIVVAMLQLVAHAFGKITLFFGAGAIATASGKKYVSELDGLGRAMPWTFIAISLGIFSMIGLPMTAGYQVKHLFMAAIPPEQLTLVTLILYTSALLNAAYLLPILYRAFFRTATSAKVRTKEAPLPCILAMAFTGLSTLVLAQLIPYLLHQWLPEAEAAIQHPGIGLWAVAGVICLLLYLLRSPLMQSLHTMDRALRMLAALVNRSVSHLHRPGGVLARNWPISDTVLFTSILLAILLVLFYV